MLGTASRKRSLYGDACGTSHLRHSVDFPPLPFLFLYLVRSYPFMELTISYSLASTDMSSPWHATLAFSVFFLLIPCTLLTLWSIIETKFGFVLVDAYVVQGQSSSYMRLSLLGIMNYSMINH
ncbi:hypothetical protein BDV33DRAFT_159570 [Aspergillus novoparasiticus]|uniref:Uncharacterized protein n=1 Tax=Aspergillus novoparasiticus TaxID=986946 RepID=A0A5N6EFI1_9EURO|nr:hypothetical protein BDV33DRAFT_159570 [Aspergillus novoparasiticus]